MAHLSRSDFKSVRHLSGEDDGAFNQGIVLVRCRRNSKLYIEKRISTRDVRSGHAAREARALSVCRHPHVIEFYFSDLNPKPGYGSIYMAHCELGSLDRMITRFSHRHTLFPEGFLWKVLWDISTALCYLQTGQKSSCAAIAGEPITERKDGWEKILHRDIKPANIFLTTRHQEGQYPTAVLGDFGASVMSSDQRGSMMTAFTRPFAPPEEPRFTDASDVFSLALSVYCLAVRRGEPASRSVAKANPAPGYAEQLKYVMSQCLRTRPDDRVPVGHLPCLVFKEMSEAKRERERMGVRSETLPSWAFENQG